MTVANTMPKLSEIAIGMTYCACRLPSSMIGMRPAAVVTDVRTMARKRLVPDSMMACLSGVPASSALLTKLTMIRLSLTTTPASAMRPKSENILTDSPMIRWPRTAPIAPKGITDIITSGWL